MDWHPIGPSSYPDLKGQIQYTNSKRIADQFLSMKRDFDALPSSRAKKVVLSPNEARRSRPRQSYLYAQYLRTGYPKAAYPFTSRHDEVTHGNAIDVGVTMASGANRALTPAEFAWMHDQAQKRGFTWTGVNFGEPWHIEGATRPEILAPYDDIVAGVAPTPPPKPIEPEEPEDTMKIIWDDKHYRAYLVASDGRTWMIDALTVSKQKVTGPTIVNLLERVIRADVKAEYSEAFNNQELAIIKAAFARLK